MKRLKNKRNYIISLILLFIALGFGVTIGALAWIINSTPDITNYKGSRETTLIYSADGQLLTKLYKENRIYVPLERIPKDLKNAVVAIEDTNFYVHHGLDFWGIARAFITNIVKGRYAQGASTITQQLARNALLSQEKRLYRKIQEAYLALQFERLYTKPEILEMYLNEIYLGHSAYGVETAAQQYFGKNVWKLDLSESALIAGLPQYPNGYSPIYNLEAAYKRRNIVLSRMQELGYISKTEAEKAKDEKLLVRSSQPKQEEVAPYYIRYVRDELIDHFGAQMVYSGGLKVYTTLDLKMQKQAEDTVKEAIEQKYIPTIERTNTADKLQPQLAVISIEPSTGAIRAMVGGRGHDQFNRATQAVRQPGSAFKPFVYTTAIKQGYTASSIVNDMPMLASVEEGQPLSIWPSNFEDEYRGLVTLRTSLNHSINVAAVKLLQKVGIENTIDLAENMGITTFQPADRERGHLSLALGGLNKGVTPIEMAAAYGVFANQGIRVEPFAITKVVDKRDRVLYEAHPSKKIVLPEDVSYIMTNMLQSVITNGTGWRANLNRPVAGKTGTTNNYTDAWFVGFTPDLVTSVWIGEDNPRPMTYDQKDEQGNYLFSEGNTYRTVSSSEAVRLWGNYMRKVVKDRPVKYFPISKNIIEKQIDPISGLLATEYTPKPVKEIFREKYVPTTTDNLHGPVETVKIDKESGLLATDNCPQENIVENNYLIDSGIRVGSAVIKFEQKEKEEDPENPDEVTEETEEDEQEQNVELIKGVYIVDTGEPVQKIDPETGVPVTNKNGQPQYETKPTRKCTLHNQVEDDFLDNIWNFFKFNN